MSEGDRLKIWRNTIGLFYQRRTPAFEGPFGTAGYDLRLIEPYLGDEPQHRELKGHKPDLVAVNSDRWLCIEITLNDCEKTEQLSAYSQLDPRNLVIYGIDGIIKAPDVVCSRYFEYDEGKFCQIIVNGHLKVTGLEFLTDINLQEALRRSENVDIRNMPDIPITIIPELSDSELKISLCGHVMQLFCPECTPKTAIDIVADGLERLVDFIPITARKQLDRKVEKELDYLVATHLKNYLEKNGDQYQARGEISDHFQVRHKVNTILKQWCSEKRMPTLDDFEDD